jgi:hypothetical protein
MLLNGTRSIKCSALRVDKSNIKTQHLSFARKFSEVTRVPEAPVTAFIERAYERHMSSIDQLVKWAADDRELTKEVIGTVTGNQTGDSTVEHTIDLTKDL